MLKCVKSFEFSRNNCTHGRLFEEIQYPLTNSGQRSGVPSFMTVKEYLDSQKYRTDNRNTSYTINIKQHKTGTGFLAKVVVLNAFVDKAYHLYYQHFRPLVAPADEPEDLDSRRFLLGETGGDLYGRIPAKFKQFQAKFEQFFPIQITATKLRSSIQTTASDLPLCERRKVAALLCHTERVAREIYDKSRLFDAETGAKIILGWKSMTIVNPFTDDGLRMLKQAKTMLRNSLEEETDADSQLSEVHESDVNGSTTGIQNSNE